jgi:hypothetical protein
MLADHYGVYLPRDTFCSSNATNRAFLGITGDAARSAPFLHSTILSRQNACNAGPLIRFVIQRSLRVTDISSDRQLRETTTDRLCGRPFRIGTGGPLPRAPHCMPPRSRPRLPRPGCEPAGRCGYSPPRASGPPGCASSSACLSWWPPPSALGAPLGSRPIRRQPGVVPRRLIPPRAAMVTTRPVIGPQARAPTPRALATVSPPTPRGLTVGPRALAGGSRSFPARVT